MYDVFPVYEVLTVRYAWSGAKTNQEVIPAVANKRIVVDKLIYAHTAGSSVTLSFATGAAHDVIGPGITVSFEGTEVNMHLKLPVGQNLEFTVPAGTGASVLYFEYHLESGIVPKNV